MRPFNTLRRFILEAVKKRRLQPQMRSRYASTEAVAVFLNEMLKKRNLSRVDFAVALDMEQELADAILDGILPASEFNEDLIAEIAGLLECKPHQLRQLL